MTPTTRSEPAIDVGMPAYRRPQFIGQAIASVLAQTHTNWRLVVSENGPGGGDVEAAVREFTDDPRVQYTATGRNLGAPANWTRLIQQATSPYVTLLQDDDVWDPQFLARRVAFLERHRSCAFVFSGERKIDHEGREIAMERVPSLPARDVSEVLQEGVYMPRELISALYRHKVGGIHTPSIASVGVMSRRAALESVGAWFDDTYDFLYWDVELYMRMALRYSTGFLALRDVAQRLHDASITGEMPFDGERWIRYHDYHGEWFRRALPGFELPRQFDQLRSDAYILAALDALEQGDRRRGGSRLVAAVRAYPRSLFNPRVAGAMLALLLGRRGTNALAQRRSARRERSETLVYEPAGTGSV